MASVPEPTRRGFLAKQRQALGNLLKRAPGAPRFTQIPQDQEPRPSRGMARAAATRSAQAVGCAVGSALRVGTRAKETLKGSEGRGPERSRGGFARPAQSRLPRGDEGSSLLGRRRGLC